MARFTSLLGSTASNTSLNGGGGTDYIVQTADGALYCIYPPGTFGIKYRKSTDGGVTWSSPVTVMTGSRASSAIAVWYDRWSGISAGLIHIAYTENVNDQTLYRSIDTENSDTLSSETVIFSGIAASIGALSIVRARGGNLYCKTMIREGAEGGFFRSTDVGATWASKTDSEALASDDEWILMPGWAADNQDIMMFFWDASADEISRVLYDNSGDSWAETSIATSMVDVAGVTFPHFAGTVDITNSRNLLAAWSAVDTANADLRVWHVTESAITEVTNVITNSTDDQGLCAIGIDTDTEDWYVVYGGASGGAEDFPTGITFYYKKSTDDGSTWGSETALQAGEESIGTNHVIFMTPRFATDFSVLHLYLYSGGTILTVNSEAPATGGDGGTTYPRSGLQGIDGGIFP